MNKHTLRYRQRFKFILVLIVCVVILVHSQSDIIKNVPVGPIEFITLPSKPLTITTASITGHGEEDLIITYDAPRLSIFTDKDHTHIELDYSISLVKSIQRKGKRDLLICVTHHENEINSLQYEPDENVFTKNLVARLQQQPYMLKTADVSGNGYQDIIVLLENQTGVGVLQNNGDGTFRDIEFLFDEIFISMFQVVDLNGDGINDFVLYDPIQNMLRIHYGFGRMTFALERRVSLPASIDYFQSLPIIEDAIYDLITMFPGSKEFRVFLGDGLGRYSPVQTHRLSSASTSFLFADLFNTRLADLIVAERETGILRIFQNDHRHGFKSAGKIQLPVGIDDMKILKNSKTNNDELYVLDIENNRLIVLGLLPAAEEFLPPKLALASEASDMVTANLFGGELPELYILCEQAETISVYWYNRQFELNHTMISLPGNPDRLYVHRGPSNKLKLIVSEKKSNFITVVSMNWYEQEANVYGIPAMTGSDVIYLGLTSDERFQFGTVSFTQDHNTPTLSLFDQIASDEYIEHTITPIHEEHMLALDVVDLSRNNAVDIIYLYRNEDEEEVYLTSALNDSNYVFRKQGNILSLEDSTATRGFVIAEKSTMDDETSFIVYLDDQTGDSGRICRVRGERNGTLSLHAGNSTDKFIHSASDIYLLDSPNEPYSDIVYYNARSQAIEIMQSTSNGLFAPERLLKKVDDYSSLTVYSEPIGEIHMLVIGRKGNPYVEVLRIDEY